MQCVCLENITSLFGTNLKIMKNLIVVVAALTLVSTAQAEVSFCETNANLAASIMRARQGTTPATRAKQIVDESIKDKAQNAFASGLVQIAYESPRYNSEQMKQQAISDFSSAVFVNCLKTWK